MRTVRLIAALLLLSPAPLWAQGGAEGVPVLRRVMLSSGGVAYVEYQAQVNGEAMLRLPVPLEQVDDVLKSLVVFDARGGVGGATLPGLDGTRAAFGDVPFGPEALEDVLAYLNALRGVEMEVRGARPMSGRLLRAERVPEVAVRDGAVRDGAVARTRVTLLTADGLRQFVLEEVESVQVANPVLRGRIARALEAMRRDAGQEARVLTLRAPGEGSREVRVGYVVGAPLWKVSYRVGLPARDGEPARLQGWAVLENTTGADWNGVAVALQYGNPVTFRQALYRSYFVQRPEVPVEVLGRILPGVDTRATAAEGPATRGIRPVPAPAPPSAAGALMAQLRPEARAAMAPPSDAAAATEGAQETVFALPSPVTLAAGHTATLPILDRTATARRVGLVQPGRAHPLASIRLTNDTATSLPAGVLTLYDPASPAMFAGDARLGGLPAGESRLLSFAEDLRTEVRWRQEDARSLAAVSASQGVLRVDERLRITTQVTLVAPATEPRELLVEVAKLAGGVLVPDAALVPVEETAAARRFAVSLKPGEQRTLVVRQDRIIRESIGLLQGEQVVARVIGMQGLDPASWAALQRLVELRAAVSTKAAEVEALAERATEIDADQERVRRNLGAVPAADAMHGRLLRQLEALENRMDEVRRNQAQARAAAVQAQRELEMAISRLAL